VIEPPSFLKLNQEERIYQNTSYVFPEPLVLTVLRVIPVCDGIGGTHKCPLIKLQVYGVPYLTRKLRVFSVFNFVSCVACVFLYSCISCFYF